MQTLHIIIISVVVFAIVAIIYFYIQTKKDFDSSPSSNDPHNQTHLLGKYKHVSDSEFKNACEYSIIIFVPGFFSGVIRPFYPNFKEQMSYLKKLNIEHYYPKIRSNKHSKTNINIILKLVESLRENQGNKKIIFITHSKGGTDVLHFLLEHGIQNKQYIDGLITIQAPFAGTPLADKIVNGPRLNPMANNILRIFRGDQNILKQLTTEEGQMFLQSNKKQIELLIKTFRFLQVVGGITKSHDGVVPIRSQLLPYKSNYVNVELLDHLAPIMPSLLRPLDRKQFLKSLVLTMLSIKK
ncbi:DUF1749 domain-containing protein [Bacteriovoracaceae bacterium]|nr:DUF1749 domain-containing protein [Bacteriovoracaceae bacterium]